MLLKQRNETVMRLVALLLVMVAMFLPATFAPAQPKPADKKDAPRPLLCIPLGVVPGVETKIIIRGQRLDSATELRFGDVKATVKIVSKGKANVPNMQDAAKVGDTQLEAKVTLPADFDWQGSGVHRCDARWREYAAPAARGQDADRCREGTEQRFQTVQAVKFPQVIDGAIGQNQDVDVFRFDGQAGQQVVIEVFAARLVRRWIRF